MMTVSIPAGFRVRDTPVYRTDGPIIADEKKPADGFMMSLGLTDTRLALAAVDALAVPMPVASLVLDYFIDDVWIDISDELPEQFDPSRCASPGPPQTPAFPLLPTALVPVRLDRS
jgi:hypothetical protein